MAAFNESKSSVSIKVTMPPSIPISIPIPIPISDSNPIKFVETSINKDQYELTANIFDPTKSSPPNIWNIRLKNRIAKFDTNNVRGEKYYFKLPPNQPIKE